MKNHIKVPALATARFVLAGLALAAGCGESPSPTRHSASGPAAALQSDEGASGQGVGAGLSPAASGLKPEVEPPLSDGKLIVHELREEAFIESPSRRDPFRSYIVPLTKQDEGARSTQISSILGQYQLDELSLIAVVSGSGPNAGSPMAMILDPTGVGHVVRRGNYVGQGETVRKVSSGEEVQIFWKVARIREDAVVFERDDPFSPTEATVTKVLALEGEGGGK